MGDRITPFIPDDDEDDDDGGDVSDDVDEDRRRCCLVAYEITLQRFMGHGREIKQIASQPHHQMR